MVGLRSQPHAVLTRMRAFVSVLYHFKSPLKSPAVKPIRTLEEVDNRDNLRANFWIDRFGEIMEVANVNEVIRPNNSPVALVASDSMKREEGVGQCPASIPDRVSDPLCEYDSIKRHIADAINAFLKSSAVDLEITVHQDSQRVMVKVIRKADGEVIREIPPREFLDLAAKIKKVSGLMFAKAV